MSTQFVPRDEAVKERDRDYVYTSRTIAYDTVPKQVFLRGWTCSRSVLRNRWQHPEGQYRTDSTNDEITLRHTVREILPGETVPADDPFLEEFVHYTIMAGFLAFDTERKKQPVMLQVPCFRKLSSKCNCRNIYH